jgi:hypothetical protein
MAINKSSKNEVVTVEFEKFTGLCNMEVVAINPSTTGEIENLGYKKPANEPEYITVDQENGHKKVRIDVYLEKKDGINVKVRAKLAFWLEQIDKVSQSGNYQWINNIAQSCYALSTDAIIANEKMKWFDTSVARKALIGEVSLHDFVKVWANVGTQPDENGVVPECRLEKFRDIFNGDFSELHGLVNDLSGYEVKVLLGIRVVESTDDNDMPIHNFYQDVYSKMFARSYQTSTKPWNDKLSDEYGAYKNDYQNSLIFQKFDESKFIIPDADILSNDENEAF